MLKEPQSAVLVFASVRVVDAAPLGGLLALSQHLHGRREVSCTDKHAEHDERYRQRRPEQTGQLVSSSCNDKSKYDRAAAVAAVPAAAAFDEDELTDLGRSLDEPLAALERWMDGHWAKVDAARRNWDRRRS